MEGKRLLERVRDKIRLKHYSIRTEEAYLHWAKRYILFHGKRHPQDMGAKEVEAFLTHIAVAGKVSASTQNQAKSSLLFLYKFVLELELPWMTEIVNAKSPQRLPVVLTRSEVNAVLACTDGTSGLILKLVYGTGMRIMESLRLRVKDIDFERNEIVIREGKGAKDRMTMLPQSLVAPLKSHLVRVKELHESDLRDGFGDVFMPNALARKYPNAGRQWIWAAPAYPYARGIRTSVCSTIRFSVRSHIQGSAFVALGTASRGRAGHSTLHARSSAARQYTKACNAAYFAPLVCNTPIAFRI